MKRKVRSKILTDIKKMRTDISAIERSLDKAKLNTGKLKRKISIMHSTKAVLK